MKNRIGMICMALGTLLLAGAVSLFLWNQNENRKADAAAQLILDQIVEEITAEQEERKELNEMVYLDPYNESMTEKVINGQGYIGYLTIPSLNLQLPVMADWDYNKLQIAPCRYYGSTKTGDLVIAAHNYSSHFARLSDLKIGEMIIFTDMDGNNTQYETAEILILNPTDVEEMTAGEYELSLFTCTYSGQSRVTVRCMEVEEN